MGLSEQMSGEGALVGADVPGGVPAEMGGEVLEGEVAGEAAGDVPEGEVAGEVPEGEVTCEATGVALEGEAPVEVPRIRVMTVDDYDEVCALWERIHGFALRSLDDSRDYVARFLARNPASSCVAEMSGRVVGSILCGHDGRQGSFYHVCVAPEFRKHGIGKQMVRFCLQALAAEGISKATLVAFDDNEVGNKFWSGIGWTARRDFNSYEFALNEENITRYVQ